MHESVGDRVPGAANDIGAVFVWAHRGDRVLNFLNCVTVSKVRSRYTLLRSPASDAAFVQQVKSCNPRDQPIRNTSSLRLRISAGGHSQIQARSGPGLCQTKRLLRDLSRSFTKLRPLAYTRCACRQFRSSEASRATGEVSRGADFARHPNFTDSSAHLTRLRVRRTTPSWARSRRGR